MNLREVIFLLYADIVRVWDGPGFFLKLQRVEWYSGMLRSWVHMLGIPPGKDVLEVGCGPGLFTAYLANQGYAVTGIDRSIEMIQSAVNAATSTGSIVRFDTGDARSLPYPPASFSYVLSSSLINIVSAPVEILREMSRVTRVGGTVSFLVPSDKMTMKAARIFARSKNLRGFAQAVAFLWAARAPKMATAQVERIIGGIGGLHLRQLHYCLDNMILVAVCTKVEEREKSL